MPVFNLVIFYLKAFYLLGFCLVMRPIEQFQALFSEMSDRFSFFQNFRWHLVWLAIPTLWIIKFFGYGLSMFLLASLLGHEWFVGTSFFQENSELYAGYASSNLLMQIFGYFSVSLLSLGLIFSATWLAFVMGLAWIDCWVFRRHGEISYALVCNLLAVASFFTLVVSSILEIPFNLSLHFMEAKQVSSSMTLFVLINFIISIYLSIRVYSVIGLEVGLSKGQSLWAMIVSNFVLKGLLGVAVAILLLVIFLLFGGDPNNLS